MVISYNDSILNANIIINILQPAWHDDTTISFSHGVYMVW
jgi:hypothetical protein